MAEKTIGKMAAISLISIMMGFLSGLWVGDMSSRPYRIKTPDLNSDGRPDLVVRTPLGRNSYIQREDGTYQEWSQFLQRQYKTQQNNLGQLSESQLDSLEREYLVHKDSVTAQINRTRWNPRNTEK